MNGLYHIDCFHYGDHSIFIRGCGRRCDVNVLNVQDDDDDDGHGSLYRSLLVRTRSKYRKSKCSS